MLVVEQDKELRFIIHNALRKIGFRSIQGVALSNEVFSHLNSEDCDWLLMPFDSDTYEHTFQLLTMCRTYPELTNLRLSAFTDDEYDPYLSQAFEMGLMSVFPTPREKPDIEKMFTSFQARLRENESDTCLFSSCYLRSYLEKTKNHLSLLAFEEELLQLYPGKAPLLINLAKANALNSFDAKAEAALQQAVFLDKKLWEKAEDVRSGYIKDKFSKAGAKAKGGNILGLEKVLILDPDESCLNGVMEILEEIGVLAIKKFSNPQEALDYLLSEEKPSLIISEWKLPKISGPIFIQRLQQAGLSDIPIILLSSLVDPKKDMPFIKEMGVYNVIKKPLDPGKFLSGLIWSTQQMQRPTDLRGFELKFHTLINKNRAKEAAHLLSTYISNKRISEAEANYFKAEIAYAQNKLKQAKVLGILSLKAGHRTVRVFNLVGKVLMKLRDFENAIKCFESANQTSPMNILRLCALADAHSELGNEKKGFSIIQKLKGIDPQNPSVSSSEVNLNLTKGDIKAAHKIMMGMENINDIMAFLNNRGIALAKAQNFEEAKKFYEKAILSIPDNKLEMRYLVHYNLSLCHVKAGHLDAALKALDSIKKTSNERLKVKVSSLKTRIKAAMKANREVKLEAKPQKESHEKLLLPAAINKKKGDLCTYLVYKDLLMEKKNIYQITTIPAFRQHASSKAK